MPKQQLSRKRVVSEEYESDRGFVEDAPKSKKAKNNNAKAPLSSEMKKDDEGCPFWDLSGKRRITVQEFKGTTMIALREYYEKDGKMLPGKKGISLSLDQFNTFVELLPQVESVLKSKGADVPRPQYDQAAGKKKPAKEDVKEEEDEAEDDEEDVKPPKQETTKTKSKLDKFRMKQNHEATSDEDNA